MAQESEVVRIAREYREQLARNEDQALRRMARSWAQMERELKTEYFNLAQQIQDLADSGAPVPKEWLYQQRRYQEMLQQVDKAIADYDKDAVTVIADYQRENWNLGLESARAQVKTSDPSSWIWNEVSRDSAETMAGFAGNGAPLAELLKRDYADLGQRVTDALITGIGLGKGAYTVAKDMRDAMSMDYDRSVRIARTEINRAYRLANAEQYRASGVVQKVVRLCYPPTACFACLELDGEECPNGICEDHPNGKCTTIAVTIGGVMPEWQHGHEWLMEQSEEDQRRIIGDERYELWKKDHIPLRDMVQMKPNPVWGGSPSVISINNLKQRYNIGSDLSAISLPTVKDIPENIPDNPQNVPDNPSGVIDGKNLVGTWERRKDQFGTTIEDVINAQGFDGIPKVVSREEFEEAVRSANEGHGFIAQRTYSASSQEILDMYQDALYHGQWYVDCSSGGAAFGQGMYGAGDYEGELSRRIQQEMTHYIRLNGERIGGGEPASDETKLGIIRDQIRNAGLAGDKAKATEIFLKTQAKLYRPTPEETKLVRDVLGRDGMRNLNTQIQIINNAFENSRATIETFTLDPSARLISSEELLRIRAEIGDKIDYSNKEMYDDGVLAALLGYDGIQNGTDSGSYIVVLNRTKIIFLGG